MAAPVGKSQTKDAARPRTLTRTPTAQPIASRRAVVRASQVPITAGTIRYENTSSTPATRTELVTTRPKVR